MPARSPRSVPPLALAALLAGAVIRVGTLGLAGTEDVTAWKVWSYRAAVDGPARIYGEEFPPRRHVLTFGGAEGAANYPPLAIDELAVIGRVYGWATRGAFPDSPGFTVTIKGAIALMDLALAALLFGTIRPLGGSKKAWWGTAAYWVSPAVLITATLGYIDVFLALPAVGALVAASRERPIVAGGLFAAAVMTKPQALFVGPAVLLALWNVGALGDARRRLLTSMKSATIVIVVLVLPVVFAGTALNLLRAMASLLRHDMLSGYACNLWWIAGYVIQVAEASHRGGVASPIRGLADIVPISSVAGYPRLIGSVLTLAVSAWALWTARRARDLALFAAVAAFVADAYFTLSAQVHENHFFVVVPLLVLAATLRRQFAPILTALGVVFALNLYLFYGIGGEGAPEIARTFTIVDSTVLLSIVNCGVFAWFAMVLGRACRPSTVPER